MRYFFPPILGLAASLLVGAVALQAQSPAAATAPPVILDSSFLAGFKWRNIGPDRGERSPWPAERSVLRCRGRRSLEDH